jgi:hypothetical protein
MNNSLLKKHIKQFVAYMKKEKEISNEQYQERIDAIAYYQKWTKAKMKTMTEEDVYEYISKLWAMLIWGNKRYVVDKLLNDNGLENFKAQLIDLVWNETASIENRWDIFRKSIKGMGPAMMSEILCKTHPNKYIIWNRRAYNGLNLLGVKNLPVHNYQLTGKVYKTLSTTTKVIADELKTEGFNDPNLLSADYFIWHEFYAENLTEVYKEQETKKQKPEKHNEEIEDEFIHNDVRDAIRDIGNFLGFDAAIEKKVAEGSKVDAIWQSKVGNMGRIIYVFEVQTKGSIDSLILNLLQSLNNPAVQGVVAVSDRDQLERIRKRAATIPQLKERLKYWDYAEILKVYESLEFASSAINNLKLVPDGF